MTGEGRAEPRERLTGIDVLRGLVMVLMALDHARDFVSDFTINPTDLTTTTPALFFTRWITHFCAPVFVFLAGTSAWLAGRRRTRAELSAFLVKRGLWLILLEFTVIHLAWMHSFDSVMWFLQVIVAIGVAMIALAALVHLPVRGIVAVGLVVVCGHNLLDPVEPADLGPLSGLWILLHEGGLLPFLPGSVLNVVYPLLPWVGVLALGYGFGSLTALERSERRRRIRALGTATLLAFVVLRATNLYGDSDPWVVGDRPLGTALSFLNCQKYPPSLLFLAMTLGPALLFLSTVDREPGRAERVLATFGRVPLFYYVAHVVVLHTAARVYFLVREGVAFRSLQDGLELLFAGQPLPPWFDTPLWVVHLFWLGSVVLLYPACAWYAAKKRRGRAWFWSYL